jgi:hypothetical protein
MFTTFVNACKSFFTHIKNQLKNITKPTTATIAVGALSDLPRSKPDLIAENAILLFRPIYIFIIIAHQTREIKHAAVTRHPTDAWAAQQLREATPWGQRPKYLIRDNDGKYGKQFSAAAGSSGIKEVRTPIEAPRANSICERFIGSMRRECLDHFLLLHQRQLTRLVRRYVDFYDRQRPHQGIDQQIPVWCGTPYPPLSNKVKDKVTSTPILRGLHHSYGYAH